MDRILARLRQGHSLRPGEVAEASGISTRTVQRLMEKGALAFVRISESGERRVPADEARAFIERSGFRIP